MKTENLVTHRTSVALTKETISRLKSFAKQHKLQMYELVGAMTDVLLEQERPTTQVIAAARKRQQAKQESKDVFAKTVAKLPEPLREKLKEMTVEELEELLK